MITVARELAQDLRYGMRTLRRRPGFAILVVLTLGLGLGANAAIFSLLDAVLLRAVPVHDHERVVILAQGRGRSDTPMLGRVDLVPHDLYLRLREQRVFAGLAVQDGQPTSAVIQGGGANDESEGNHAMRLWVSGNYFDVLGVRAFAGRALGPADDQPGAAPVVVLSHRYWTTRFGADPGIVGAKVTVNGRPHTVVGVMAAGFVGLDLFTQAQVFIPIAQLGSDFNSHRAVLIDKRETRWLVPVARLAPGVSVAAAEAAVNVVLQQYLADDPRLAQQPERRQATRLRLDPGGEGLSAFRDSFRTPLAVLMVGVGVLLLIVCLNVSHLLLARTLGRQRELSVRAAVGASRARLLRQLLAEGLLLALLGALAGLALTRWLSDSLIQLASSANRFAVVEAGVNGRVVAVTLAVALLAALLLGLVPARQALRSDLQQSLRASSPGGGDRRLGGQILLGSQVAFSLVLLVGAGLLASTLQRLRDADRGFEQESVLLMWVSTEFSGLDPRRALGLQDEILRQVKVVPGVAEASLSFGAFPSGGGFPQDIVLPDGTPRRIPMGVTTPGFLGTYGLRLVAGRDLARSDGPNSPPVVLVNQTMARQLFGDTPAVGQRFRLQGSGKSLQVVGVIRDLQPLEGQQVVPLAYVPAAQSEKYVGLLQVRAAGDPGRIGEQVRQVVRAIHPSLPVRNVRTLKTDIDRSLWRQRLLAALSTGFGASALFLVCVGLYGVISQWAGQRTREIGVRVALGATGGDVRWLVLRQAFRMVLAGVLVGLPGAFAAARLLEGTLYGMAGVDPVVLAGAALLLFVVAAFAAYLPARRASRVDPMQALRMD